MEASQEWLKLSPFFMKMSPEMQKEHFHLLLLRDQGFVEARGKGGDVYRLTSQGYDFLEAIRDEGIWKKTRAGAEALGGATLGLLRDLAVGYLKNEAAERLGISL